MIETVRLIEDLTDRALGRSDEPVLLSRPPSRSIIQEHLAAMVENARVNEMPEPAGRSRFLKRLVLRLTGFTLVRQRAMNQALIGVVNAFVRPVLVILTFPITVLTLGFFYLIVNGAAFGLAAALVPGFTVASFGAAVGGAVIVGLVSWALGWLLRPPIQQV